VYHSFITNNKFWEKYMSRFWNLKNVEYVFSNAADSDSQRYYYNN